jgi:hypothetical protein
MERESLPLPSLSPSKSQRRGSTHHFFFCFLPPVAAGAYLVLTIVLRNRDRDISYHFEGCGCGVEDAGVLSSKGAHGANWKCGVCECLAH